MNIFTKRRMILWLLILVTVANTTALITLIILYNKKAAAPVERSASPGSWIRDELSLSAAQETQVRQIDEVYKESAMPVADSIKSLRMELLDELAGGSPDPGRLKQIKDQLCAAQSRLQDLVITQFLAMKKVCTPEQAKALSGCYEKLYGCDSTCRMKGKGHGRCNGEGKGNQRRYHGGKKF